MIGSITWPSTVQYHLQRSSQYREINFQILELSSYVLFLALPLLIYAVVIRINIEPWTSCCCLGEYQLSCSSFFLLGGFGMQVQY